MTKKMCRLDNLLVSKGLVESRTLAQSLIAAGKVKVEGRIVDKAGTTFPCEASMEILSAHHPYVSRGGVKLEHALREFNLSVDGFECLDVGASTGGFTDCLLQHGAARVYAVDVGYGQMDWKLRQDPRVVLLERTNIRYLPPGGIPSVDISSVDTSFISLKIVIPSVMPFVKDGGVIMALIKPQFEVGKNLVGKGGIVKDQRLRQEVVSDLVSFFSDLPGLSVRGVTPSPILGAKGNMEFLILLSRTEKNATG